MSSTFGLIHYLNLWQTLKHRTTLNFTAFCASTSALIAEWKLSHSTNWSGFHPACGWAGKIIVSRAWRWHTMYHIIFIIVLSETGCIVTTRVRAVSPSQPHAENIYQTSKLSFMDSHVCIFWLRVEVGYLTKLSRASPPSLFSICLNFKNLLCLFMDSMNIEWSWMLIKWLRKPEKFKYNINFNSIENDCE